ncbi:MAG TPA: S-layer homology domain-containing protein [Thermoanaerobaculia bacterium]|jgi:hypothetical protein
MRSSPAVRRFSPVLMLTALVLPCTLLGQSDIRTYGTKDKILVRVSAAEFTPIESGTDYVNDNTGAGIRRYSGHPGGTFVAPVHLPSGALVTYFALDYCDSNVGVGADVLVNLELDDTHGTFTAFLGSLSSSFGNAGCDEVTSFIASPHTYNAATEDIIARVQTGAADGTNSFSGVFVGYKLQMSPAPAFASFADVPTDHPYFRAIQALASSGITSGCGSGNFCPEQPVTRGELAKFLAVALGLHWPN